MDRRQLLGAAAAVALASSSAANADEAETGFMHHVFFWLKEPNNEAHRKQFLGAIAKMKKIPTIQRCVIGKPAGTPREVVDNSWTFDWYVTFAGRDAWQVYNDHEIHKKFIEEVGHLWERVQVYDTLKVD